MSLKYRLIGTMFEVLALSRLSSLVRAMSRSRGVIFTLHRVLPGAPAEFAPNGILQVTPEFLDAVLTRLAELGVDVITLDDAIARIKAAEKAKPFAVLTFDDAYRDNLVHALPVLKKHGAPFTIYVPTALVDGDGEVWWQAIEDIIATHDQVTLSSAERMETITTEQKQHAYDVLYWRMRKMPEAERVTLMRSLAAAHDYDLGQQCRDLIMNWDELQVLSSEALCTIGAHTVHHYELAKLPEEEARDEMGRSADVLEQRLGRRPAHISYPIGGTASAGEREYLTAKELGFSSGVTTRPGGLYVTHAGNLTALPRISLNGLFQKRRYVDVFASGAVFTWQTKLLG